MTHRPDFGYVFSELESGGRKVTLSAKAIVPGVSLHELVKAYDRAFNDPSAGHSGDPSKWPVVMGVRAVADKILDALYPDPGYSVFGPFHTREECREFIKDQSSSDLFCYFIEGINQYSVKQYARETLHTAA